MDFLEYSSQEPMRILRKKFNNGEKIDKKIPEAISVQEAMEDILYTEYVFKNAYSGYGYYDEMKFEKAFQSLKLKVSSWSGKILSQELVDLFADEFSFISDGHLTFTIYDYGRGFYQKMQTYVSDCLLYEKNGYFFDFSSDKQVVFDGDIRVFPTIPRDNKNVFILGTRSKEVTDDILVKIDSVKTILPVRKIKSESRKDILLKESYEDEIAIVTCSSFVGDKEEDFQKFFEAGKKCRKYKHVIWNLSNNLGGNSEFPKRFLTGLDGGYVDISSTFELQSTLVHTKETGEIKDVPYQLVHIPLKKCDSIGKFNGKLHVIVNDQVASSTELAIAMANQQLPGTTFYGCHSLGIGHFGDVCIYYLPNSHIILWCPQKVFDMGIEEELGFEPDYWIDENDPLSVVLAYIKSNLDR